MYQHLVVAESYGAVLWAPEVLCGIVRFHGFVNAAQCQHLMAQALTLYTERPRAATRPVLVLDTQELSALPVAAHLWLASTWNTQAYAAGLRQIRFVTPTNIFGQIALQLYMAKAQAARYAPAIVVYDTLAEALTAQAPPSASC